MKKTSKAASTLTVILGLAVMLGGILVYGLGFHTPVLLPSSLRSSE